MKSAWDVAEKFSMDCFDAEGERCKSVIDLRDYVARMLTEYADERVKEALACPGKEIREARASALEEAAGVAAEFTACNHGEKCPVNECDCPTDIGFAINALIGVKP